jgi:protocatechuate 3,4-dioxygenase beta subunit
MNNRRVHPASLPRDLETLLHRARRRDVLWLLGAASLYPLIGCGSEAGEPGSGADGGSSASSGSDGGTDGGTSGSCSSIPEETAGPYPGDGSNGPNALALSGIVRSDIRTTLGDPTSVATGVPLTITLTLVNPTSSCAPIVGAAVYLWHCDALGRYSLYSSGVTGESWLRGVQATDASGKVQFTTIFPGCYSGRWPHVHFEIYPSLAAASTSANKRATSQLALPQPTCAAVYATSGYTGSTANLANVSLATDMVFSDGATLETPAVTGDVSSGYQATLTVGVVP